MMADEGLPLMEEEKAKGAAKKAKKGGDSDAALIRPCPEQNTDAPPPRP